MRRTKIVATVGPASESPDALRDLIGAGLDVARLNFSHGSHERHGRVIDLVRRLAAEADRPVAILQDLAGPKIRTGPIAGGEVELEPGGRLVLTTRDVPGDADEVGLTYAELPRDVRPGDRMLLSDGALELEVERTGDADIVCRVLVGGPLSSHKGINLPSRSIGAELPTAKDLEDLDFGIGRDVDLVALSYVRGPDDVERARRRISEAGRDIPLIAKIEKQEAVDRFDDILTVVDGIMVARGDLGVEIPLERIPGLQKSLIDRANHAGRFVITATQMLGSMVASPRPTRAEVTDVANAVLDGTDAVMLSEETAVGRDPAGVVRMMARIAAAAEADFPHRAWAARLETDRRLGPSEAVARAAWRMAEQAGAAAILTLTISGSTTRLVARQRPGAPVLALTPEERTRRRLAPIWGAVPLLVPEQRERGGPADGEAMVARAVATARDAGLVAPGQTVVVTAGLPLHVPGITNLLRLVEVGPPDGQAARGERGRQRGRGERGSGSGSRDAGTGRRRS